MIERTVLGVCMLSVLCAAGCGSDDKDTTPTCPAGPGTIEFTIADISPARGATVPNQNIVEKFTIKNAPAMINNIVTSLLATHTAGAPVFGSTSGSALQVGDDLICSSTVASWATAPGHVEMTFSGVYKTSDGCVYAFPSPMFSYDVVPATGGDAGTD